MSELIAWNPRFSVTHEDIDNQHKRLVALINLLAKSKDEGKQADVLEVTMNELANYINQHFQFEEDLLKKNSYPDFEDHRKEHLQFKKWLTKAQNKLKDEKGKRALPQEVLNYLKTWLTSHIMVSDKKYIPCLKTYIKSGV